MSDQQPDLRRISEMRNLGPVCEQDLNAVGLLTAADLIRLGPAEAFVQMLEGRVKRGRTAKSVAMQFTCMRCTGRSTIWIGVILPTT